MNNLLVRMAILAVISVIFVSVLGACQAEPTPTPTPLPTPTPTATPTPEPTPVPMTQAPLGADIMPLLPPEEVECIRTALGEDFYNVLLQTPFTPDMLTPEAAATSPVTGCLSEESQAIFAEAVMGGATG